MLFYPNLLKNHTGNCLTYEENKRQPYTDNLSRCRALAPRLHGNQRLEETSKIFNFYMNKMDRLSPRQFHGVHLNEVPIVEDLPLVNILLYDIDIVEGNNIGELARRRLQKHENNVRLLRYKNHICCVRNIKAVFQSSRCPNCDTFNRKSNL